MSCGCHASFCLGECEWSQRIEQPEVDKKIRRLEAELKEQLRLNGMGSEREAKLMAMISVKDRQLAIAREALAGLVNGSGSFFRNKGAMGTEEHFKIAWDRACDALARIDEMEGGGPSASP